MNEHLQRDIRGALGDILASAPNHDAHPTPVLITTESRGGRGRWIVSASVAAAAAAAVIVLIQINASDRTGNSDADATVSPAGAPVSSTPLEEQLVDRYVIDGMAIDTAEESPDRAQSVVFQNTPDGDQAGALPAVSIETGTTAAERVARWPILGESVHVDGEAVAVRGLNDGDPLAATWTTSQGTTVTVVGEGMTVAELQDRLEKLRQLTADEWHELVGFTTLETRGPTTTTTIVALD